MATREYRHWGLCARVCAESLAAAGDDGDRALDLAHFAREIAEVVPGRTPWRDRVTGYAWAHVTNAERARGDLQEADRSFAVAKQLWQAGAPGDPALLDEARFLSLEAALREAQGRPAEPAGG
jgi:hypothetical protein